jgi:hypothetical protein
MQSLQSVGVLSCAKIMGAIYGALGLLIGPMFLLTMVLSALTGSYTQSHLAILGGFALLVIIPIFYGALGFGMGALSAWIYNVAAKKLGGIELELRDARF